MKSEVNPKLHGVETLLDYKGESWQRKGAFDMGKGLRIGVAIIFVLGVLLLARGQMAWAGGLPVWNSGAVGQNPAAANAVAPDAPGTVKPPPVVVPPISGAGTYSVGGVCTIEVISLAADVSVHAVLLPLNTVGKQPDEVARLLAGVCQVNYVKSGAGLTDLAPADGSVKICFSAIPTTTDKIYVYADKTWTALDTTVENGLACAFATKTGRYVLTSLP